MLKKTFLSLVAITVWNKVLFLLCTHVFSVHDSCLLECVGVCYGCIKSHLLQQYVSFLVLGLVWGSLCLRGWNYSVSIEFSV